MILVGSGLTRRSLLAGLLVMALLSSFPSAVALDQETVSRRDLVIDLGDGLTTDAQLTFPAVGDGPFTGMLLVHGSGSTDMDEYLPPRDLRHRGGVEALPPDSRVPFGEGRRGAAVQQEGHRPEGHDPG